MIEEHKDENGELRKQNDHKEVLNNLPNEGNMISESEVKNMISQAVTAALGEKQSGTNQDLIQALRGLTESNKEIQPKKAFNKFEYLDTKNIPKDDILDPRITFWSPGFMYVIGDDIKNGISIPGPYGTVVFEADGSKRLGSGKEASIQIWNKYVVESKKELDFLRNHHLFGIRFFEKSSANINLKTTKYASTISSMYQGLLGTSGPDIITQCQAHGIEIIDDIHTLRVMLATKMAEDNMERIKDGQRIDVANSIKEKMLVDKEF